MQELTYRQIFSTLGKSLREFKRSSVVTPVFVLGEVAVECSIPFITASLIDRITAGGELQDIAHYAIVLVLLALFSLLCGTMAGITCAKASTGFARNLRHDAFARIQGFSFSNIDRFSTSSLVTRLTTDVNNVQQAFMMLIRLVVRAPLLMLFSIIMAFLSGGPMAVVYVIVSFFLGFGVFKIALTVMPIFKQIFSAMDPHERLRRGERAVSSGQVLREGGPRRRSSTRPRATSTTTSFTSRGFSWNMPLMTLAIDVIYAYVIYFGSKAIVSSQAQAMGVGQMSALITYGFSMLMSLMMLSMVFVMVTMAEEGARRLCEVPREERDLTRPGPALTTIPDGSIDFDHVSFEYSRSAERMALDDIDLHIKSGEVIGILGGTGSSKSTLVQLVSRLYDATKGTVRVGGHDVREYDLKALRDQVAMVLQRNVLFSGTIKDNLRWGDPNATDDQILEACKLAQADEFIQLFPEKYDTYIEQGGTNVSGGQKQRLCIARALLKRPKILILDDSTSAVDTKTDKLIREGFKSYIPETTKVIIAQRTSSIEDCDRIVVMKDGRIDDIGTHEELLRRNDIYRETYTTQNKQSHDVRMSELAPNRNRGEEGANE